MCTLEFHLSTKKRVSLCS